MRARFSEQQDVLVGCWQVVLVRRSAQGRKISRGGKGKLTGENEKRERCTSALSKCKMRILSVARSFQPTLAYVLALPRSISIALMVNRNGCSVVPAPTLYCLDLWCQQSLTQYHNAHRRTRDLREPPKSRIQRKTTSCTLSSGLPKRLFATRDGSYGWRCGYRRDHPNSA